MIGVAAGMTIGGLIPFTGTFANFSTGRVYDQIRQSVAYSDKNVKICASHCGLTLGEDGATHQILEDVGMMKMLPNMTVIHTCDYEQTRNATHAIAAHHGPVYFRFGRPKVPMITEADAPFVIGQARRVMTGSDVTLVTNGHLVWNSILAARQLAAEGISVDLIDMHTIKPLDKKTLLESASRTGCVVAPRSTSARADSVKAWPLASRSTCRRPSGSSPSMTASVNPEPRLSFSRSTAWGRATSQPPARRSSPSSKACWPNLL